MKHFSLAPVTLFTLTLTALLLPASGWFAGRSAARTPSRFCQVRGQVREQDSGNACRQRTGQGHWRTLILQRN